MKPLFLSAGILAVTIHCASVRAPNKYDNCEKITVGAGTEDFALGPDGSTIYVSSHERRSWKTPGDIFAFNIKSRQVKKLTRSGEPADVFFAPHGIDIYKNGSGVFLYVVNHGREQNDSDQRILIYRVKTDALEFIARVKHEFINSPNDLAVTETGSFYVSNDHGSRGSIWELMWGLKRSKLTFCNFDPSAAQQPPACIVAAGDLGMANGPLVRGDKVYLTVTREDAVYSFKRAADGSLSEKTKVAEVAGGDNLSWYEQHLITASHTSNWKFFRHVSSQSNKSPSSIVAVDPVKNSVTGLYFNDGSEISAASGAFIHNGRLYISQVFGDFILECRPVQ